MEICKAGFAFETVCNSKSFPVLPAQVTSINLFVYANYQF